MRKFQIGLIILAAIVIIAEFFIIDYEVLFDSKNIGNFAVMFAMTLLLIGQILAIRYDKKR